MHRNIQEVYSWTLIKYRKFKIRYDKNVKNGRFFDMSQRKQNTLISRLRKLQERLEQLKLQIKVATATGLLSLALSTSVSNAQVIGPFENSPNKNPLKQTVGVFGNEIPAIVDIDGDGDLDVFVSSGGFFTFLENTGTQDNPYYVRLYGTNNPLNGSFGSNYHAPTFADLDNDGDFDLIFGENYQYTYSPYNNIRYFENTGDATSPDFDTTPSSFPNVVSQLFSDTNRAHPTFVDIDNDGDLDAFIGGEQGFYTNYGFPSNTYRETITFWRNDAGSFTHLTGSANVAASANTEFGVDIDLASPEFIDIDGDGDQDMFVGDVDGNIHFFRNTGTADSPDFASETIGSNNPLDGENVISNASPKFADFDNDGDFDAIIGNGEFEPLIYFENIGSATNPNLVRRQGDDTRNPFGGIDVAAGSFDVSYTSQAFADLDNDGHDDIVFALNYQQDLVYYKNDGNGKFSKPNQSEFEKLIQSETFEIPKPALVDIDNNGTQDLFVALRNIEVPAAPFNPLEFFSNSSRNTPTFTAQADLIPIGDAKQIYSPTFGDVDNDNDYDLVLGSLPDGTVRYFENRGTPGSPILTERTGSSNPFSIVDNNDANFSNIFLNPFLVDIDHDGDVDLFAGVHIDDFNYSQYNGRVMFYENVDGSYIEQTAPNNPLSIVLNGRNTDIDFADIDQDGDLDAFISDNNGNIFYYENVNVPPRVLISEITNNTFTEGDEPLTIIDNANILDFNNGVNEDDLIISASIQITNVVSNQDILTFIPSGNITGSYNENSGTLILSGIGTDNEYEAIIETITYSNTSENPDPSTRIIQFSATDFDATDPFSDASAEPTISIPVIAVNDAPVLASTLSTPVAYLKGSDPIVVDNTITISDVDESILTATVAITNYIEGEDILEFSDINNITGSFNASTGVLNLTGTASIDEYQQALQTVTYSNSNQFADVSSKIVEFLVTDNELESNIISIEINITNSPPVVTLSSGDVTFIQAGDAIFVDEAMTISDSDNETLESATITIISNYIENEDELVVANQSSNISGAFDTSTGMVTLTGPATISEFESTLQSINYNNLSETPNSDSRTIEIVVNDGIDPSTTVSKNINIQQSNNEPPVVDTTPSSTQLGSTITIDLCNIISDPDNEYSELTITVLNIDSEAVATIEDCDLIVNYENTQFLGQDNIEIQACDPFGACSTNSISINVTTFGEDSDINIYNAVSPNNDNKNDWWIIEGLEKPNEIELYNRWGDLVKTLTDYIGDENTPNDALNDLPVGTYFYKIKSEKGNFTGYLVIKK